MRWLQRFLRNNLTFLFYGKATPDGVVFLWNGIIAYMATERQPLTGLFFGAGDIIIQGY